MVIAPHGSMRDARGFTLIEVIVVVALVAILAGLGSWQMQKQLLRYRPNAAAGRLVLDVRKAGTIASRTNRPVTLTVNPDGCSPGYMITGSSETYERVCFAADYKGVVFSDSSEVDLSCDQEKSLNYPEIPVCSLCTGTHVIRFLPNGEVITPSGDDVSLVLHPDGESASFDRAVGIRNVTGKARAYKRDRAGSGWECL